MNEIEIKDHKAKLTITYSKKEWEEFVDTAYEQNKNKFNVQGFRKGKAPRKTIEQNYGPNIFYDDAMDLAFNQGYVLALQNEKGFEPIDEPKISIKSFDDNGLVMIAEVETMPEVELGAYKNLEIKTVTEIVKQEDFDNELEQMRERHARYVESKDSAKNGDIATIDFCGKYEGVAFDGGTAKDYRLTLGSHSFVDNFEDQVVGMKTGESKDVCVTFPEDYNAENLAGKSVVFEVTLNKVEEKILPALNDAFASDASEFETLDALKIDLKTKMEQNLAKKLERENEDNLIEAIVKASKTDVPSVLVEKQLDMFIKDFSTRLSMQGLNMEKYLEITKQTEEELKKSRQKDAKEAVKARLVLEKLIEVENVKVTETELNSKIEEMAKKYGKTLEEHKNSLGERQIAYLENDILMSKLLGILKKYNKFV
ncbi:MAG: trigger factor [Clostridia bacterium]